MKVQKSSFSLQSSSSCCILWTYKIQSVRSKLQQYKYMYYYVVQWETMLLCHASGRSEILQPVLQILSLVHWGTSHLCKTLKQHFYRPSFSCKNFFAKAPVTLLTSVQESSVIYQIVGASVCLPPPLQRVIILRIHKHFGINTEFIRTKICILFWLLFFVVMKYSWL